MHDIQGDLSRTHSSICGRQPDRKLTIAIVGLVTFLILFTRSITIAHNIELHPDEHVFVKASVSLVKALFRGWAAYEEDKPYPQGAYVFQMPFHALQILTARITGTTQNAYLWGRIAGVFYFTLGWLLGARILYSDFRCSKTVLAVYGISACFSLFLIEQSRYGTGDPISGFLLNLVILCTLEYLRREARGWLFPACAAAGALAAVKYPLLYFSLIPLSAVFMEKGNAKTKTVQFFSGLLIIVVGFLVCSPSALKDWHYILQVVSRETYQYVTGGSFSEQGGFFNHLLSLILYHLLYSDIPLGPVFFGMGVLLLDRRFAAEGRDPANRFLSRTIPILCLGFFIYNLFVPLMYFRTYYPFFWISLMYSACGLGTLLESRGVRRRIAVILLTLMAFRGCFLVYAMSEKLPADHLVRISQDYTDNQEKRVVFLEPIKQLRGLYVPGNAERPEDSVSILLEDYRSDDDGSMELRPGDLVITGNLEFGRAQKYLLPIKDEVILQLIDSWKEFQRVNEPYLCTTTYPALYYYLFGYYLKGSSAGSLEFPDNFIYYRMS